MKKGKVIVQLVEGELELIGKSANVDVLIINQSPGEIPHSAIVSGNSNNYKAKLSDMIEGIKDDIASETDFLDDMESRGNVYTRTREIVRHNARLLKKFTKDMR